MNKKNTRIISVLICLALLCSILSFVSCVKPNPQEKIKYTVTFNYNYDGAASPKVVEVEKDDTVSKPTDPTREEYTFDGWYATKACTGDAFVFTTAISSNITLYAKWTKKEEPGTKYTVTFNLNYQGSQNLTQEVDNGKTATKPSDPTREKFAFGGWYTTAQCTGNAFDFSTAISANTTLYAKWVATENPPTPQGDVVDPSKTISKLAVKIKPTKSYYVKGDILDLTGGVVTVTYTDGTTQDLTMLSTSFEVTKPNLSSLGNKTCTLKIGTKKCSFSVKVADKTFAVTYVLNYDGAENIVVDIARGDVAEDKAITRDGFVLFDWYADADYTHTYDFDNTIESDVTVYALWKKDGSSYVDVTFDRDYYGNLYTSYSYPVAIGEKIVKPSNPLREGYTFSKWTLNGEEYNFDTAVSAAITLKAVWNKNTNEKTKYLFEAEDTDLSGKSGPATSGTCQEIGMIVTSPAGKECSNNRFVSFMYQQGNSVDFVIVADEDLNDVTLWARLSAEYGEDFTYDKTKWAVYVNDESIDYGSITFRNIPVAQDMAGALDCLVFQDYQIGTNLNLKKGKNMIRLVTENSIAYEGTTMLAHAPIIDCIKVETTGVVTWDANYDLPKKSNY